MKLTSGNVRFFSVIIPTLNEEKYLPKLLRCLVNQIDKDFEVIVVDGKSEDKTVDAAGNFSDSISSLTILNAVKRNVSYQRNLGAKYAKGKFLVFFDADTQIPFNFLSQVHNYLLENRNCNLLTTWMKPDSKSRADQTLIAITSILIELAKAINKPFMGGANVIIKKSIFEKVRGFDEKLKLSEDHDLAQRLLKSKIILHILKEPRATISLRRFRREGTINLLRKYAVATSKLLFEGPITDHLFDYPMGGKVSRGQKKVNKLKLTRHLNKFQKYFNRINFSQQDNQKI